MLHSTPSNDINREILNELNKNSKLPVIAAQKNESNKRKIVRMDEDGFDPVKIAPLIGETPGIAGKILAEFYCKKQT